MDIVLMIHSILRWLIIAVAAVAVIKFTIGWRGRGAFSGMDRGLTSGFNGLVDVQVLLGFIYFFWNGTAGGAGFPPYRLEHMGLMVVAAVVAHLSALWKKSEDKVRFRNTLFVILDTMIIILIGVARLPGGWSR